MSDIINILEKVVLDDDTENKVPRTKSGLKCYPLSKIIARNKLTVIDITFWEWKIFEYLYMLYRKEIGCCRNVNLDSVLVTENKHIIDVSIVDTYTSIDERSEARLINTMLNVHTSMFRLINGKHYSYNEFLNFNMLRIMGNFFYAAAATANECSANAYTLVKYAEQLHVMVRLGMVDELSMEFLLNPNDV